MLEISGTTPQRLGIRLLVYFGFLIGAFATVIIVAPSALPLLPIGGIDVDLPGTTTEDLIESLQINRESGIALFDGRLHAALVLITSLSGTIVLMIPITWVYMATKLSEGFSKSLIRALVMLPICATSMVLLIQDSLALAFGLAALVAAVQFRVRLQEALDGIYVFVAVCVGLASGVGYLGVGLVMTVFFCFASVILWGINYGANPIEEAKQAQELNGLVQSRTDVGAPS